MADEEKTSGSGIKQQIKPGSGKKKNSHDYKSLTGRQKAAIFLVALGSDVSSEVMKHLREDEVETLTFEIARLETVDAEAFGNVADIGLEVGGEGRLHVRKAIHDVSVHRI